MITSAAIHPAGEPRRPIALEQTMLRVLRSLAAILLGIAAFFVSFERVQAADSPAPAAFKPSDMRTGSLLLRSEGETGGYADATRLGIDVDLTVSGPTIRARVTQIFRNPTKNWVEALRLSAAGRRRGRHPEDGDRRPHRGRRHQESASRPASSTKQAKQNGCKAALTEQERPNIFTNSVANIGPGETVLVQIEYQEPVRQSGDVFCPRADGRRAALQSGAGGAERRLARQRRLGRDHHRSGARPRPHLAAVLDPASTGQSIRPPSRCACKPASAGEVKSHHHAVQIESPDRNTRVIKLAEARYRPTRLRADRRPAAEKAPSVGLFREHLGQSDYLLAFVTPPAVEQAEQKPLPREVIFVIDNLARWAAPRWCRPKRVSSMRSAACSRTTASTSSASTTPWMCCFPARCRLTANMSAKRSRSSARWRRKAAPRWCRRCARR